MIGLPTLTIVDSYMEYCVDSLFLTDQMFAFI